MLEVPWDDLLDSVKKVVRVFSGSPLQIFNTHQRLASHLQKKVAVDMQRSFFRAVGDADSEALEAMKSVLPFSLHEVECSANSEVQDKAQNEFLMSKDRDETQVQAVLKAVQSTDSLKSVQDDVHFAFLSHKRLSDQKAALLQGKQLGG